MINALAVCLTKLELFLSKDRELTSIQRFSKKSRLHYYFRISFSLLPSLPSLLFSSPSPPHSSPSFLNPFFLSFLSSVLYFPLPYPSFFFLSLFLLSSPTSFHASLFVSVLALVTLSTLRQRTKEQVAVFF